jgi:hypothetical protein
MSNLYGPSVINYIELERASNVNGTARDTPTQTRTIVNRFLQEYHSQSSVRRVAKQRFEGR